MESPEVECAYLQRGYTAHQKHGDLVLASEQCAEKRRRHGAGR